jgi:hypothetical protein
MRRIQVKIIVKLLSLGGARRKLFARLGIWIIRVKKEKQERR